MDLVLGALLVVFITILGRILQQIWRPYAIAKFFKKQGVSGPGYRFGSGSIEEFKKLNQATDDLVLDNHCHDITKTIRVYYNKWFSQFGKTFLYWNGTKPQLCISDMEMVKEVLEDKVGLFSKMKLPPTVLALLGNGLVSVEGDDWVRHRKVLNPAFAIDKLKFLTRAMADCTKALIEEWHYRISQEQDRQKEIEVEVSANFHELATNVIAHTTFGNDHKEGKEVFLAQRKFLAASSFGSLNIPGSKYYPTKENLQKWKLEKVIRNTLTSIIKSRLDSKKGSGLRTDLLGLMLDTSQVQHNKILSIDEIIDECKTFFFAGQETTSLLLTWTMFLLSTNRDWQEKLREEVIQHCGNEIPNAQMLSKLKLVNMVLLEALRLYSPIVLLGRETAKDSTLGNIKIPKGVALMIPIATIHRDKKLWGADSNEFNPLRFENGVSKAATHPNAFLPFSITPRSCIGQNFAMLEAKMVLAMILQQFSFVLSPKYKHAPHEIVVVLHPKFGLPIILRPLHV
ncbi:cytochrome P450 709B1-like [Zingiber officinale]|uniref:cytochrome P450 709B1-like n=1 Tax=Zingiber officinale TaxID=94328 RepID=UPI001C4B1675|nr:cytochrome P450 709B1-like [Zingiber officinale]